jgi:dihydrofolate reductase
MHTTLIAARDEDGAIGRHSGGLPWHLPDETAHFRAYCQNKWLIVGRHTFNEMLGWFQPGHHIIVLTSSHCRLPAQPHHEIHIESAPSMEAAQTRAIQSGPAELVVIGGARTYAAALPTATRLVLTTVHLHSQATVMFPPVSWHQWRRTHTSHRRQDSSTTVEFTIETWERTENPRPEQATPTP